MAVDKDLFGTLPPLRKPSVLDTYLRAEIAERIQQREDEMVFGYNKVKADMVREIMYGGGRSSGKTHTMLNSMEQDQNADPMRVYTLRNPQVTFDGEPVDTVKFDMSYYNTPTYTHSFTPENSTYEDYQSQYLYSFKSTLNPTMYKDLARVYLGFTRQTVSATAADLADDAEQPQEPEVAPKPRVFRYSKYKDRSYMDSMVFWLKNPFKDDILSCAETNS